MEPMLKGIGIPVNHHDPHVFEQDRMQNAVNRVEEPFTAIDQHLEPDNLGCRPLEIPVRRPEPQIGDTILLSKRSLSSARYTVAGNRRDAASVMRIYR